MDVNFFLCAEAAVVDSTSNKLTILNVAEELATASFPTVMPQMSIVFLLSRIKSEAVKPRLNIVANQNKREIFNFPVEPDFQGQLRARAVVAIQGIIIQAAGKIIVNLIHKKKTIASWPIQIIDVNNFSAALARHVPPVASATNLPARKTPVKKQRHK